MPLVTRPLGVRCLTLDLEQENTCSSSSTTCRKRSILSTPLNIPSNKGKKMARYKSTITATKYVQNVIILKQNFLNNFFSIFSKIFSSVSLLLSISYQSIWKQTRFYWCMTFFLNNEQLLKISFVLALGNP